MRLHKFPQQTSRAACTFNTTFWLRWYAPHTGQAGQFPLEFLLFNAAQLRCSAHAKPAGAALLCVFESIQIVPEWEMSGLQ
jgi:hypothetical protein